MARTLEAGGPPWRLTTLMPCSRQPTRWKNSFGTFPTLANAFRGEPRMTMDIDGIILIDLDDLDAFLTAGEVHGFAGRHPATADFGRHAFLLRLLHTPTITPIDLAIGMTSFEREAVEQAQQVQVAGGVLARNSDIDLAPVRRLARHSCRSERRALHRLRLRSSPPTHRPR